MQDQKQEPLKSITLLHTAMLVGTAVLGVLLFFLSSTQPPMYDLIEYDQYVQLAAIVVVLLAAGIGYWQYHRQLALIRTHSDQSEIDSIWRSANLVRWALLSFAADTNFILFFLSSRYAYLALGCVVLLYLIWLRPTEIKYKIETGKGIF